MVAGMERYYQIARRYRDEDFRADRQPEFTQPRHRDVVRRAGRRPRAGRGPSSAVWKLIDVELRAPVPRMTYADAMRRFGSDKPDLRFGNELVECTDYFRGHALPGVPGRATSAPWSCPAAPSQPRKQLDAWQDWAKSRGAKGLAYVARRRGRGAPVARSPRTSPTRRRPDWPPTSVPSPVTASSSPPVPTKSSRALLGAARLEIGRRWNLIDEDACGLPAGWSTPRCSSRIRGRRRR